MASNKNASYGGFLIGIMRIITIKQKSGLNLGKIYQTIFPFKWHRDNYTKNLSNYYGFSKLIVKRGF